ncbi:hypothetical protein BDN72DRAFT_867759 [Pluteus cervinus]|uniref:Uncharacterized protein n=1 Tax=Pluteus cervinus TaxID=181527 RepID=A0ACD3BEN1_9AGAR|nr:hypothetical protein BDN72DRAFT_867759 [Pluteus cervinus]
MASHPAGEPNQQLWQVPLHFQPPVTSYSIAIRDETLTRLLSNQRRLSKTTLRRNTDLEGRVAELEVELSVWKQAHSVALEAAEREAKAHNVQVAALNKQISGLDCFRGNQHPLILCVLNGDENIFSPELLMQGHQGGRIAAQTLTKLIAGYLSNEDVQIFGRLSFWITFYVTKVELADRLSSHSLCSPEQFEDFLAGFSQSSPRFLVVDVGYNGDGVDSKIKGRIDSGYLSTFGSLESEQLLGKVVLLQSPSDAESESPLPVIPRLTVERLFMSQPLPYLPRRVSPMAVCPPNLVMSPSRLGGRVIDPSLPLHKQNPPPCNEHYLMTCSKGPGACKYSHDYILTADQLVALASNAKKAPCNWLKNGVQCPYGDRCCWGHVCPNGPKCFHLSKGKCWFKGGGYRIP